MAEEKKIHWISYVIYYPVLFLAFWFGSSRFDQDGDGDFDPSDIEKYLTDKNWLHGNFKKGGNKASQKQGLKGSQPAAAAVGKPNPGGGMFTDKDGDGDVDLADVFAAEVEGGGQGEEDEVMAELKQHWPWFMIIECAVCFGLWFIMSLKQDPSSFMGLKAGIDSFADGQTDLRLSTECKDQRFEFWRWFTYQWSHVGAMHVLMNVFLNVMLGIPLEGLHGHLRMALMFNVGVFGGACCFMVNDAHTIVVGCSGGCYSLIGMHFADLVMNWKQKKFRWPTLIFIATLVAVDILSYSMSLSSESTSHSAHIGGFIAGLGIGVIVGKNLKVEWWEKVLRGVLCFVGVGLVLFCFWWNIDNQAPRNIWEAGRGESGYCWVRQVYNATLDKENWLCVRCGTHECIDYWTPMRAAKVSQAVCSGIGFQTNPGSIDTWG